MRTFQKPSKIKLIHRCTEVIGTRLISSMTSRCIYIHYIHSLHPSFKNFPKITARYMKAQRGNASLTIAAGEKKAYIQLGNDRSANVNLFRPTKKRERFMKSGEIVFFSTGMGVYLTAWMYKFKNSPGRFLPLFLLISGIREGEGPRPRVFLTEDEKYGNQEV